MSDKTTNLVKEIRVIKAIVVDAKSLNKNSSLNKRTYLKTSSVDLVDLNNKV